MYQYKKTFPPLTAAKRTLANATPERPVMDL